MPRVKLLVAGYVRGNALVGSTHVVSQAEADQLVAAGVATLDETETIQATEIEQQRQEILSLAARLQATEAALEQANAKVEEYEGLKESADAVVEASRQTDEALKQAGEVVADLERQLQDKNTELEQAKSELAEAVRVRTEGANRERDLQYQLDDLAKQLEEAEAATAQTELPADFPGRDELIAAGHTTVEAVKALTEAQLNAVPGIGEATIKKIREYTPQAQG